MTETSDSRESDQAAKDELTISRAGIDRYLSEVSPNTRVGANARELLQQCCTKFIHVISSEANQICDENQMKTITADHLLKSLVNLGFGEYVAEAEDVLRDCKALAATKARKCSRLEDLGIPESDMLKIQLELFAKARADNRNQRREMMIKQNAARAKLLQKQQQSAGDPEYDNDHDEVE